MCFPLSHVSPACRADSGVWERHKLPEGLGAEPRSLPILAHSNLRTIGLSAQARRQTGVTGIVTPENAKNT